jgi:hypothetical protein
MAKVSICFLVMLSSIPFYLLLFCTLIFLLAAFVATDCDQE